MLPDDVRPVQKERRTLSRFLAHEWAKAFEAVGGWFFTFLVLGLISLVLYWSLGQAPVLFLIMVTYATAISLVLSAPFHTLLSRYLADVVFQGDFKRIIPNVYGASLAAFFATLLGAGVPVFAFSHVPLHLKICFVGLAGQMALLWTINTVLYALLRGRMMSALFAGGLAVVAVGFLLMRPSEAHLLMLLLTAGLAVPVAGGYAYLTKTYLRDRVQIQWSFLAIRGNLRVALSLFLFYAGFWLDKVVFWWEPRTSVALDPFFRYSPAYDYPFFVAFSTMMFGFVLIYRDLDETILNPYESFVTKLDRNFPFKELALEKFRLYLGMHASATNLTVFYGGLATIILLVLWFKGLVVPWSNPVVFHFLLMGTVAYSVYHLYFLILQYLDEYGLLLAINGGFALLNASVTWVSIRWGWAYYGVGFLTASSLCAVLCLVATEWRVGTLEFQVFRRALRRSERPESS
ncbi:Uncharacterized membrane protein [Desulfacinum hydrothermale DSM 13146]|uniref:Uncharacterized membrane protein n=1 Tax=Desulfacinum hydrothermale DSM 13146 TaxID=1121390 RepID=A0A1W1X8F8_9BACT|nr:exopolysaccharide Pel transporter PelG [Desulfacinum hydrothermale]SMC20107.1 Uncharacterized membrane protein [Desulfacinum hydrothermale DSM 13146]